MAFPESFWVGVAAAAPIIALANVVTISDSISVPDLVDRVNRAPFSSNLFFRRLARRGAFLLGWAFFLSIVNLGIQTGALALALLNLDDSTNFFIAPSSAVVIEAIGIFSLLPIAICAGAAKRASDRIEEEIRKAEESEWHRELIERISTLGRQTLGNQESARNMRYLPFVRNRRR